MKRKRRSLTPRRRTPLHTTGISSPVGHEALVVVVVVDEAAVAEDPVDPLVDLVVAHPVAQPARTDPLATEAGVITAVPVDAATGDLATDTETDAVAIELPWNSTSHVVFM